jgi:hypothetical protein
LTVAIDSMDADAGGMAAYRRLGLGAPFAAPRISEVVDGSAAAAPA